MEIDVINQDLEGMVNKFIMSTELWNRFIIEDLGINYNNWLKVKYFDGVNLHNEVERIPIDKGGIYVFLIKCPIIPECGTYIMYVGSAQKTSNTNIKNRISQYFSNYTNNRERAKITRLFDKWKDYIYLAVLPLDNENNIILEVEKCLIDTLLPPCNSKLYNAEVKRKVSAFN